jgi:uncharacterized glyoxalase superfamily protein PhnB
MMSISLNPYLIFNGNTKEAVHFYEKALGGKVISIHDVRRYAGGPESSVDG